MSRPEKAVRDAHFYPRPPRGGRRPERRPVHGLSRISIHALREEGDFDQKILDFLSNLISIHALREEGDILLALPRWYVFVFLSTPSARRATGHCPHRLRSSPISIHALREEGDPASAPNSPYSQVFLSTPSARRATLSSMAKILRSWLFLSTPSARRATIGRPVGAGAPNISIHALREEGDPSRGGIRL